MAKAKYGMIAEKMAAQWKKGMIPRSYRVGLGDSYYRIAGRVYGDQSMAGMLMAANRDKPNLQPGMRLRIPKPNMRMRRPRFRMRPPTERV